MRAEGWLHVRLRGKAEARHYLMFEGYVLRVLLKEPRSESPSEAVEIIDLRMVEKCVCDMSTSGTYKLITKAYLHKVGGPCGGGGVMERKVITIEPNLMRTLTTSSSDDDWWMRHLACAVPDAAIDPRSRLRKQRDMDGVLRLMSEHMQQPSAHEVTDEQWRKSVHHPNSHSQHAEARPMMMPSWLSLGRRTSSGSSVGGASSGGESQSPRQQEGATFVAERLERARAQRGSVKREEAQGAAHRDTQHEEEPTRRTRPGNGPERELGGSDGAVLEEGPRAEPQQEGTVKAAAAAKPASLAEGLCDWWYVRDHAAFSALGPLNDYEMKQRYQKGMCPSHECPTVPNRVQTRSARAPCPTVSTLLGA